jgi:hypothetical protein
VPVDWLEVMQRLAAGARAKVAEDRRRLEELQAQGGNRGETLGVYVPTPRKAMRSADLAELRATADRLAEALSDVDEEEVVSEFKQMRRRGKAAAR